MRSHVQLEKSQMKYLPLSEGERGHLSENEKALRIGGRWSRGV